MKTYLEHISSPEDVKKLNASQLAQLCEEIRGFLIDNVSKTGGHLSSNLGTIEITVALHKVFSTPHDSIVWDVGHQCYTHKILTGRKEGFVKLRQLGGLSGFPAPKESEHDIFIAGHGNTAISAAIGIASAKKLQGDNGKVIAIVGDGAFTGGMVYEGMNNIRVLNNLIVILNDNEMSISKNVGSVAQYLTKLRTSPRYFAVKRNVENVLDATPFIGGCIKNTLQNAKQYVRRHIYSSTMFENMGFQYVGPTDGHNVEDLVTLFSAYKNQQTAPLFVHLITTKGKGFTPAEENPGEFHGVSAFDVNQLNDPDISPDASFSTVFGEHLALLAENNKKLCAITAAMKYGTGLQYFYRQHKERFYDVGMAEQHAVTFSAGLAAAGMKPVVAVYSTFLQRSYDQIIHDVNLQHLNVLLAIDRAGFVPNDGETHQGIYDAAFLSQLSNVRVISPCNYAELTYWLEVLVNEKGTSAIRYPRGAEDLRLASLGCSTKEYDVFAANDTDKAKTAIVTYGNETAEVLEVFNKLKENGNYIDFYKLCQINPLPTGFVDELTGYSKIIFAEEGVGNGGIGEHVCAKLQAKGYSGQYIHVAADSDKLTHGTVSELRKIFGLDAESLILNYFG